MPTQITLSTGGTVTVSQSPLEVLEAVRGRGGDPVRFSDMQGGDVYVNPVAIVSWQEHDGRGAAVRGLA